MYMHTIITYRNRLPSDPSPKSPTSPTTPIYSHRATVDDTRDVYPTSRGVISTSRGVNFTPRGVNSTPVDLNGQAYSEEYLGHLPAQHFTMSQPDDAVVTNGKSLPVPIQVIQVLLVFIYNRY